MQETDDEIRRQGRRRLRALLPSARAAARGEDPATLDANAGIGRALLRHLTEDKLDALEIYQGGLGGWQADLVFRDLPRGLGNRIGTRVSNPYKTMKEAEAAGYDLLVGVLAMIARPRAEVPASPPGFQLYNLEITLGDKVMLEATKTLLPFKDLFAAQQAAIADLEHVLHDLMPGGFSREAFGALPNAGQTRIIAVATSVAATGVVKYPAPEDLSSPSHRH